MAYKRLAGPSQLTNATVTQYTVPANTTAIVRHVHVSNPSGGAVTFTMSVGADAAGTRVFDGYSIAAGAVLDWYPFLPLKAAELIAAFASVTTTLVIEIAGEENVTW